MTTVVDPVGTPTIIYNRGGTTMQSVTATGTIKANYLQLQSYSEMSVFLVTTAQSEYGVLLPANSDVGDVVEIYRVAGSDSFHAFANGSDTINGSSSEINGTASHFLKVSSTDWRMIRTGV